MRVMRDTYFGYLALATALIKDWDPDVVFRKAGLIFIGQAAKPPGMGNKRYTDDEVREMAWLRAHGNDGKPMTYRDIAELFSCDFNTVYVTLKRRGMFVKGHIGKARAVI